MDRAKTLAQMIWLCFAQLAYNQASIFQRAGNMIQMVSALVFGHVMGVASCLVFYRWLLGKIGGRWELHLLSPTELKPGCISKGVDY